MFSTIRDKIKRSDKSIMMTNGWSWLELLYRWRPKPLFFIMWAASSEFVSSSVPSWQIIQSFRGAKDLVFRLKVPLDSLLVWASSGGSGETARMRRLAWTFTARIGDKYQTRLARPMLSRLTLQHRLMILMPFVPFCHLKGILWN